jgi:hypothetical protein
MVVFNTKWEICLLFQWTGKTDWFRIMCRSSTTCLLTICCFSELVAAFNSIKPVGIIQRLKYGTTDYNHVRYLKFSRSEWLFLTPSGKFVCYLHIMARTSYMSMRWWWCPLCIRLVWFMEFNATFNNISVFVLYQQAWLKNKCSTIRLTHTS